MKKHVTKTLAMVFALLFVISAILQYNDPDPYYWYAIYGAATLISLLFIFDRLPMWLALLAGVLCIVGGVYSWPMQFEGVTIGGGEINNIEEGREALGLFITSLICLYYALSISRRKPLV